MASSRAQVSKSFTGDPSVWRSFLRNNMFSMPQKLEKEYENGNVWGTITISLGEVTVLKSSGFPELDDFAKAYSAKAHTGLRLYNITKR